MVLLSQIIQAVKPGSLPYNDKWIHGMAMDSRKIQDGFVFVAVKGLNYDGHDFIHEAIHRGAVAVFGTEKDVSCEVPYIQVEDSRAALAKISAVYYGYPALNLVMIGVTGTDGKTTTCNLIYEILKACGISAGMISTVNAVIGDETVDTGFHVTTPEAPDIQHFLSRMVAKGITHVILETTSHALEQKRVNECEFDLGVITNVTHEHLDYHGSFEAYLRAKSLLFQSLSTTAEKSMNPTRGAVLNFDDPSFDYLSQVTKVNMIHYGLSIGSNFRPENIVQDGDGLSFSVASRLPERPDYHIPVRSKLFGEYNILNILAACALTIGLMDLEIDFVRLGIEKLKGIPGRMEKIDLGQEFLCFVDFAHTPNALENVLRNSRKILEQDQIHQGRIIAVFGSAGLRDKQKRNMMAKISGRLADISILTAEDPRTESLEAILLEMEEGIKAGGRQGGTEYHIIPDRGEAIQLAIDIAEAGDMVIICGKGHEQSMCFGNTEYLWDDRTAALSAISKRLGIIGPAMPYLPTSRK